MASASGEWSGHGQGSRHRPGNDELGDRGDGRRPGAGDRPTRKATGRRRPWSRFLENGERLVAMADARRSEPKGTMLSAKRFIGRKYDEVSSELTTVSFDVVAGPTARRASRSTASLTRRGDLGAGASEAGRRRREVPRRAGHRGASSPSGALQRRAARATRTRRRSPGSKCSGSSTSDGCALAYGWTSSKNETGAGLRPRRRHVRRRAS